MKYVHEHEPYRHDVSEWTVGELRRAMADLPDTMRVRVAVPEVPTTARPDEDLDTRYVVTGTAEPALRYDTLLPDGVEVLIIVTDYPTGTYMRRTGEAR